MKRTWVVLFLTLAATFAHAQSTGQPAPSAAQPTPNAVPPSANAAQVEQRINEAKARLKLTPEQEQKLRPIVKERNDAIAAIRAKHAGDTSRRARREMFQEAKAAQQQFEAKVAPILDDSQRAEWQKMRDEAKQRMKEQVKAHRAVE